MKVEFESETQIVIDMGNGKKLCILSFPKSDEVTIISQGEGQRHVKEVQNRQDGHSSVTLTEQK